MPRFAHRFRAHVAGLGLRDLPRLSLSKAQAPVRSVRDEAVRNPRSWCVWLEPWESAMMGAAIESVRKLEDKSQRLAVKIRPHYGVVVVEE